MGVKACVTAHLQICDKPVAQFNTKLNPHVAIGWVLPLLYNVYLIRKVCSLQASVILCNIEKFCPKSSFYHVDIF